jgi:hypothetical protein
MRKEFLAALTPESIANDAFPLAKVLDGSLFYPASGTDGSPIRHWPLGILSFIYVDWFVDSSQLDRTIENRPPRGYRLLGMRELTQDELVPAGWQPVPPVTLDIGNYRSLQAMSGVTPANAFGRWSVFERDTHLDAQHGPARFSLVFLRAEGLATCQALYGSNGLRPGAVAILRPGTGSGGNFGDFEHALIDILGANRLGMPPWLLLWHSTGKGRQPEGPWAAHYGPRRLGPFSKDGEEGRFQFSIYPALESGTRV